MNTVIRTCMRFLACLSLASASVVAQAAFPEKTITIIVPFGPGGSPDFVARAVAPRLAAKLGQSVVVENRPGAGGSIGTAAGAKASPDGYTLTMGHIGTLTINPFVYRKLPYDPLHDFAPITLAATIPLVVVVAPSSGITTLGDLIARAKASPDKLTFASGGNGTASHMAAVLFNSMAGIKVAHIPYGNAPAATTAIIGGDVTMGFGGMSATTPLVKAGKLRALAVTSATRAGNLSDVPTVIEAGLPGYSVLEWNGFLAPRGTPPEVLEKLHAALFAVLSEPALQNLFRQNGYEPSPSSPAEFSAWIQSESSKWKSAATSIGLSLD